MKEVACKLCGAVYELHWHRTAREGWNSLVCLVCKETLCSWSIAGYYVGFMKERPSLKRISRTKRAGNCKSESLMITQTE